MLPQRSKHPREMVIPPKASTTIVPFCFLSQTESAFGGEEPVAKANIRVQGIPFCRRVVAHIGIPLGTPLS